MIFDYQEGHTEIVRFVLEHPLVESNLQDKFGNTSLIKAMRGDYKEIVRMYSFEIMRLE
jgi:ankyrin repeat protein